MTGKGKKLTLRQHSKDIDAYIVKIKQDYQKQLQERNDKSKHPYPDDGKHPIRGGGLEEWKVQNAKIVNNGMIMAEEGGAYEPSDKSRASTMEPGQPVGPEGVPRSTPSMFTAINRHNEGSGSGSGYPSPMQGQEGLPGGGPFPTPGMLEDVELDVMEHLKEWEGTRIADYLGGAGGDIQGFSYGDVPESNLLFGEAPPVLDVWR